MDQSMEKEELLSQSGDSTSSYDATIEASFLQRNPRRKSWVLPAFWALLVLYIPLFGGYVYLFLTRPSSTSSITSPNTDIFPSPPHTEGAIAYELRKLPAPVFNNPFAGDPSPESDAAWHQFFTNNNIRVSKAELDALNLTSLPLADGSGYIAQLGVFHELHCLKRIRHWVYRDYYFSDDTPEEELREDKTHIDHCIEALRVQIVCRASTSLSTYRWQGNEPTVEDHSLHQCVDWDRLREWNDARAVHLTQPGLLERPA